MVEECFPRHQAVFGVHGGTDDLYIHFAVTCTSYEDGKAFEMSPLRLREIKHYPEFLVWSAKNWFCSRREEWVEAQIKNNALCGNEFQ